ncbi:50S ribosomal protein L21 [Patescibacteria group bacterium]|nr:50S ribosomal protein L21 [Patescibacteria group bacterium]
MKAVIQFQNKQYLVEADQELTVDRIENKIGDTIAISDVLVVTDDKKTHIGTPNVKGAKVVAEVIEHDKGDNRVATYKAKSKYRRVKGFRAHLTRLKIKSIKLK